MMKKSLLLAAAVACRLSAQQQDRVQVMTHPHIAIEAPAMVHAGEAGGAIFQRQVVGPAGVSGGDMMYNFISSEVMMDGKVVKGAPYSAESVSESIQTLADGNRIVHKNTSKLYRDAEGRTRQESSLPAIGGLLPDVAAPQIITINDPVAGVRYSLNEKERTAFKASRRTEPISEMQMAKLKAEAEAMSKDVKAERQVTIVTSDGQTAVTRAIGADAKLVEPKVEQLGKQTIEGVAAEGVRTTITIPAGQMGNERDLLIVSERWYSPELQTVVMTKRSDPRAGETTYRLSNIRRGEPSASLFQVPADYNVKEGPQMIRSFRMAHDK